MCKEAQARDAGYDVVTALSILDDKAHYYPDASSFITKVIADRASHKLLGVQVLGSGAVDKMADIAVVGISMGARVEDFVTMDFAYAPPFSTAIHPFAAACGIVLNKLEGRLESFTPAEYAAGAAKDYRVLDAHPAPTIPGAEWVDLTNLEPVVGKIGEEEKLLLVCAKGKRGYLTQNKLRALGYTNTRVLEGGATFNVVRVTMPAGGTLSPAEIKRVKSLGCLQDKRTPNLFNVRVITRNGKITTEEHRTVAEAAERFGSGEITMTTRLTLEKAFTSQEEVLDVVERAILFFRDEGLTGERFADTIQRLGFDYVQNKLLHGTIEKAAILNKTVKGGATC